MLDKSILQNLDQVKKSCLVIDLECSSSYPDGREVNISADIENYKNFAKVKWVGAYSYLYDKIYLLNAQQNAQEVMKLLQEHNTLIHFNGEEFDVPILVNNGYVDIEKKYLQVDIMQIYGTSNFKNKSGYAYKNRATLMDYKLKNNSLRCMAETMGVENLKGDIDYKIFAKNQWTLEEEKEIKTYLQSDVLATKQLFEKLWDYWLPFAELLDVKDIYNLSWIRSSIASLTYKAACKVLGTEPTYAEKGTEAEEVGGNVILPTVEEETGVWYVDFQSLYPHIFCQFNLPAEVNFETEEEMLSSKRKIWHGNEVFKVKGYYDITKQHILSMYIASKLKERIALKDVDKTNPMVYTLKILLNGLYGCFRSVIFEKIHTPNCGTDCCFIGQQIQQLAKEMLEQFGFTVIAGDTDSLMAFTKDHEKNKKEYVIDCLNQIVEIIKDSAPFPADSFKIGIEHYLDYIMFPYEDAPIVGEDGKNKKENGRLIYQRTAKKKNYLYIFTNDKGEKEIKLVGLPIIKDNATALGMKIYDEVLKPEIIKNMRAKFPASYLQSIINDYLKKPEIIELLSQEYKVKSADSYKNNAIQKQISQAYFNGQEGVIRLVKNSKVGKCGQGTLYCTVQEAIDAKLTSEELDLEKANQELSPFILYEKEIKNDPILEAVDKSQEAMVESCTEKAYKLIDEVNGKELEDRTGIDLIENDFCDDCHTYHSGKCTLDTDGTPLIEEPVKEKIVTDLSEFLNKIIQGNCLEVMKKIPDESVDMILCDLPYGKFTHCEWDNIIPFDKLWEQYERIIKPNSAMVFTANQPFTSYLIMSNIKLFKHEWVWDKHIPRGFQVTKYRPMRKHEDVLVFSKGKVRYFPIGILRDKPVTVKNYATDKDASIGKYNDINKKFTYTHKSPDTIITGCWEANAGKLHPIQKPVSLFEYLIKTYTKEGDIVLDNCCGSGTTGVACKNTKRKFIQIEQNSDYVKIAEERLKEEIDVINVETKVETTVSKDEFEACKEVLEPIKKKRGRPKKGQ